MQRENVECDSTPTPPTSGSPELAHILQAHANRYMLENPVTRAQRRAVT